jgi:hypothetical protein
LNSPWVGKKARRKIAMEILLSRQHAKGSGYRCKRWPYMKVWIFQQKQQKGTLSRYRHSLIRSGSGTVLLSIWFLFSQQNQQ